MKTYSNINNKSESKESHALNFNMNKGPLPTEKMIDGEMDKRDGIDIAVDKEHKELSMNIDNDKDRSRNKNLYNGEGKSHSNCNNHDNCDNNDSSDNITNNNSVNTANNNCDNIAKNNSDNIANNNSDNITTNNGIITGGGLSNQYCTQDLSDKSRASSTCNIMDNTSNPIHNNIKNTTTINTNAFLPSKPYGSNRIRFLREWVIVINKFAADEVRTYFPVTSVESFVFHLHLFARIIILLSLFLLSLLSFYYHGC